MSVMFTNKNNMKLKILSISEEGDTELITLIDVIPITKNMVSMNLEEFQDIANSWVTVHLPDNEAVEIRALSSKKSPKIGISLMQNEQEFFSFLGDTFHALSARTNSGSIIGIGINK